MIGNGDEPDAGSPQFEWSALGWLTDRFPELEVVFRAGDGDWIWDAPGARYLRV